MCLHPSSAYHLQLHVEMRDSSSADFLSHTVKQCLVDSTLYAVTPTPIEISMNRISFLEPPDSAEDNVVLSRLSRHFNKRSGFFYFLSPSRILDCLTTCNPAPGNVILVVRSNTATHDTSRLMSHFRLVLHRKKGPQNDECAHINTRLWSWHRN